MVKEELKKALNGHKISDATDQSKLIKSLKEIGINPSKKSDYYLIKGDEALAIDATLYSMIDNTEIKASDLYKGIEFTHNSETSFGVGSVVVCEAPDVSLTFIVAGEHPSGKYLLGQGELKHGFANNLYCYTKAYCRLATGDEFKNFVSNARAFGYKVSKNPDNDKYSLVKGRQMGAAYWTIEFDFINGKITPIEVVEEGDTFDDSCFMSGNYFTLYEDACKAIKMIDKFEHAL